MYLYFHTTGTEIGLRMSKISIHIQHGVNNKTTLKVKGDEGIEGNKRSDQM